ncbi:MAG: 50S ribosomal protein L10 [Candidatus Aminicenantes bacterium]|nr:50S ribosomal protein L10 [Candidatus Aminicenantes bacterium]
MKRAQKEELRKGLSEDFNKYNSFYLMSFSGMNVSQAQELRKELHEKSFPIKVVKNRIALRALKEDFPEDLRAHFQGTTAIAFSGDDPLGLARILKDFSGRHKVINVKAGLVEGRFLDENRFAEIATLTSKQDLIAKIGYLMAFPLMKLFRAWQAPLTGFGTLLGQLKNKK